MQQVQKTFSNNLMNQVKNILYPCIATTMLAATGISFSHADDGNFFTDAEYDMAVKKMSDSEWAYIIENSPTIINQPRLFMNCARIQSKNVRLSCYGKVTAPSAHIDPKSNMDVDNKDNESKTINPIVLGEPRVEISKSNSTKQLPILKIEERTVADRNMEVIKGFYQGELGRVASIDRNSTAVDNSSQNVTKNVKTHSISDRNMEVIKGFYKKNKTDNTNEEDNTTTTNNKKETSGKFFLNTEVIRQFYKTGKYQNSDKNKNLKNEEVPKNDKQKMSPSSSSPKSQLHLHQHNIDDFDYGFVNAEAKWNVYTHLLLGNRLYITDASM